MTPEIRKILEDCRHEFTWMSGLIAADGAAPQDTFALEFDKLLKRLDDALTPSVPVHYLHPNE